MKRIVSIMGLIVFGACWAPGQTTPENPKNEFFAGYSFHSADINTLTVDPRRTGQNGVNLEYARNINARLGLVVDTSAHFMRDATQLGSARFERQRDQYFLMGGAQFRWSTKGRAQPFAHALIGISLFRGFTSNRGPAGNVYTYDDASSFAMALGGGLDLSVNKRIAIRIIQADYTPTFFGSGRQNNFRLSVGIIFKR